MDAGKSNFANESLCQGGCTPEEEYTEQAATEETFSPFTNVLPCDKQQSITPGELYAAKMPGRGFQRLTNDLLRTERQQTPFEVYRDKIYRQYFPNVLPPQRSTAFEVYRDKIFKQYFTNVLPCEQQQRSATEEPSPKMSENRKEQTFLVSRDTLIDSLPYPAEGVEVLYTVDPIDAENWLKRNIIDCSVQAVGFDIEWKPQFVSKKKGGVENKTAVLQLGVGNSCLVLHLHKMEVLPNLLRSILNDEKIIKVGSGILQDAKKLKRDRGLICKGMVDTQKMVKSVPGFKPSQGLGLKALAGHFLKIKFQKPKSVAKSNWEIYPLTTRQIHYAALDAWIGFKLYLHMKPMIGEDHADIEEVLVEDKVDKKPAEIAVCHVCGKKFKGQDALKQHLRCKCEKLYVAKISKQHQQSCERLDRETQKLDEVVIITCRVCRTKCYGRDEHASHIKIHPQCKCGKLFKSNISKSHKRNCVKLHPEIVKCLLCKKKCKGKDALASHMKIHPQCKCGKHFVAKISKEHEQSCGKLNPVSQTPDEVDQKPVEIVICCVCKKKCKGRDEHDSHLKIHPRCKCGEYFVSTVPNKHKKICESLNPATQKSDEANQSPVKIVICRVCKKKCHGRDEHANHIKIHPQCKCGKYFMAIVSKKHKKNCPEAELKPAADIVICRVCKKNCKGQDAYDSHIKIHPQCKCGKLFVAKISKQHEQSCGELNPVTQKPDEVNENPVPKKHKKICVEKLNLATYNPDEVTGNQKPADIVICRVCKKKCKGQNAHDTHIKKHSQCKCGEVFAAQVSKKHQKNCPFFIVINCQVCKKKCKGKDALASHIKIHPQCKCGKLFVAKISTQHEHTCVELNPATSSLPIGVVNENPTKIVICPVCKTECNGEDALADHIKTHPQCKCGKIFLTNISKNHKRKCEKLYPVTQKPVGDQADKKPVVKENFVCHICKKTCESNDALATHIQIHSMQVWKMFCCQNFQEPQEVTPQDQTADLAAKHGELLQ